MKPIGIIGSGFMAKSVCFLLLRHGRTVDIISNRPEAELRSDLERSSRFFTIQMKFDFSPSFANLQCFSARTLPSDRHDILLEMTSEDLAKKGTLLKAVSLVNRNAVIATNTSSLPLESLRSFVEVPDRFLALHFLNPPHSIAFAEITTLPSTSQGALERAKRFCDSLRYQFVLLTDDIPGFIINRILFLQINEAFNLIERYRLDPSAVDMALRTGALFQIGPVRLAEVISTDVCVHILHSLHQRTGNPAYHPAPLLMRLSAERIFGVKNNTSITKSIRNMLLPTS